MTNIVKLILVKQCPVNSQSHINKLVHNPKYQPTEAPMKTYEKLSYTSKADWPQSHNLKWLNPTNHQQSFQSFGKINLMFLNLTNYKTAHQEIFWQYILSIQYKCTFSIADHNQHCYEMITHSIERKKCLKIEKLIAFHLVV